MADNDVEIRVTADTSDATSALNGIDKKLKGVGDSVGGFGKALTKIRNAITIAFAVDKVVQFGGYILNTTADLQAMNSQFNQVFKGTEGVTALAEIQKQSQSLNIDVDRLKSAWSSVNSQLKGAGQTGEQAMANTIKATQLATDASAFYDISLEESTGMLQSFMKGNFEAGDAIGVFTSANQMADASLKTYGTTWDKLTEAQKENLLLDKVSQTYQLNGAVGQASREMNNWSNVTANLNATWERFLAVIGTPLLNAVIPIVQQLTVGFEFLGKYLAGIKLDTILTQFPLIGTIIDTVIPIVQNCATAFMEMVNSVISAVMTWYTNNQGTITNIVNLFLNCFALLGSIFTNAMSILKAIWDNWGQGIITVLAIYISFIVARIQAFLQIISGIFKVIASLIKGDWQGAWDGVVSILEGAWTLLYTLIIQKFLGVIFNAIKGFASSVAGTISGAFETMILKAMYMSDGVKAGFQSMISGASAILKGIISVVTGIFGTVKSVINDAIQGAISLVSNGLSRIAGFFSGLSLKLPKIALPHFSVSGKFSLDPPSIPHIGVDWYAKGGLFNSASVIGVGEAGQEAVVPLTNNKTMSAIAGAIVGNMPDNVNTDGSIGGITNNFNMYGLTVREEADIEKISKALYKKQKRDK